jgi:tight adherence protein C
MMSETLLISGLTFAATLLFAAALYFYAGYRTEQRRVVQKIRREGEVESQEKRTAIPGLSGYSFKSRFMDFTGRLGKIIKPKKEKEISQSKKNLTSAGYRSANAQTVLWGMKVLLAIFLPSAFIVVQLISYVPLVPAVKGLLLVTLALIGFYLPDLWVRYRSEKRKEKMLEGFPDALDLMVVCVEAGMGLDQAINRVAEEMEFSNRVISDEFRQVSLEARAGRPRMDALRGLATRMNIDDVRSLVTLLIQTDKFGTSVAQALRVHSDTLRTKRHQRAEEMAMKLPVKLLIPLIFCIFPALLVVIMGPGVIQIYRVLIQTAMGG